MLILIAILLALVPAAAILYPFLRRRGHSAELEDESSTQAELARRWDAALSGLKSTELEWALGNLAEEDYGWLRRQYLNEAALVMRAMELEEEQERELLSAIETEVQRARLGALGQDGASRPTACPNCSSKLETGQRECAECGNPTPATTPPATLGPSLPQQTPNE